MNYKYWCRFLEPDEFVNWEVEVLLSETFGRGRDMQSMTRVNLFERDFDTWRDFINASFGWSNTKQGSQYWMEIFERDHPSYY